MFARLALRQGVLWDEDLAQLDINIAAVGNLFGIGNCLRQLAAPPSNNVTRVGQMELEIFQAHPLFVTQE